MKKTRTSTPRHGVLVPVVKARMAWGRPAHSFGSGGLGASFLGLPSKSSGFILLK